MNERKMASYCSDTRFFFSSVREREKKGNSALVIASFFFNKHQHAHSCIELTTHTFIFLLLLLLLLLSNV